jgi:V/A-type H+-transporting ATPase subunit I
MFYPEEMTQVRLIIPARDLLNVTKDLAQQGIFHQSDGKYPAAEKVNTSPNTWPEKASAYGNLERRILGLMEIFGIPDEAVPAADFEKLADLDIISREVDQVDQEVRQAREQIADGQKRLEQFENILHQLEPIAGVGLDLRSLRNPKYIYSILGVMPTANIARLQTSLAKIPFVFFTLREDKQRAVVWLSGRKQDAEVLDRAARSAYINPLNIPETYQGDPEEIIQSIRKDISRIQKNISEQRSMLNHLAGERKQQLQNLLWQVRASRILAEAMARFGRFRYTYVIDGWVPSSDQPTFEQHLKQVSNEIVVETFQPQRGSAGINVPVALKNPKIISSFQDFVTNYARPQYQELDPTFLLAIAFPFLFGAMFGDVGQGIVLFLLGQLLVSRRVKALNSLAGLGGVVRACGLSAFIFGFLYGSVFGFEELIHPLLFNPTHNILETLSLAILIGVILLSIGFLINIFNQWTSKNWGELLFMPHGVAGLLLYLSLVGLALEVMSGKHPIPFFVFGILALISGISVMFSEALIEILEGKKLEFEGGFVIYAFRSIFELFEVLISLLSNSISFVRVGAFAVAHVGLTTVIFILAGLIDAKHGFGFYMTIAIGNLFIIGFEGMIVGIQTMRLSYYEIFSKFFQGGGVQYAPLTLKAKAQE